MSVHVLRTIELQGLEPSKGTGVLRLEYWGVGVLGRWGWGSRRFARMEEEYMEKASDWIFARITRNTDEDDDDDEDDRRHDAKQAQG